MKKINRRSFFKKLGLLAGAAVGSKLIPELSAFKPEVEDEILRLRKKTALIRIHSTTFKIRTDVLDPEFEQLAKRIMREMAENTNVSPHYLLRGYERDR